MVIISKSISIFVLSQVFMDVKNRIYQISSTYLKCIHLKQGIAKHRKDV